MVGTSIYVLASNQINNLKRMADYYDVNGVTYTADHYLGLLTTIQRFGRGLLQRFRYHRLAFTDFTSKARLSMTTHHRDMKTYAITVGAREDLRHFYMLSRNHQHTNDLDQWEYTTDYMMGQRHGMTPDYTGYRGILTTALSRLGRRITRAIASSFPHQSGFLLSQERWERMADARLNFSFKRRFVHSSARRRARGIHKAIRGF